VNAEERFVTQVAERLGAAGAATMVAELRGALGTDESVATVCELLGELSVASVKVAHGAIDALQELRRHGQLDLVIPWLDLGVMVAGVSGAAAMKYFRESPLRLSLIEPAPVRGRALALGVELAAGDPHVAVEFLRTIPELLAAAPADELAAWGTIGLELSRWDDVLGIEFIHQSPALARVIPLNLVRDWVAFGMKLVTQNTLGKTDYLATLEFFRTSPGMLGDVEGAEARRQVIAFGSVLADREPRAAIAFLADAPALLRRLPSEAWRVKMLQYGALLAERDAHAALAYLGRGPEILGVIGEAADAAQRFEDWFRGGMEVLAYSAEGARAYFALETRKALASLEDAMSGMPLRWVARSLKLFAEGLCGRDVAIAALPANTEAEGPRPVRASVSQDGQVIRLPALLRRYPTREQNARLYLLMTAHEAGHLEFGTYSLTLDPLRDLIAAVRERYGGGEVVEVRSLGALFELYPKPALMRDLWTVLEDARVEWRLQHEYPGLTRDLAELAREAATTRSLLHGMSVRELVLDALLLLTTAGPGTFRIPEAIAGVVDQVWALCRPLWTPHATAEDVVRLADRIYVTLDTMITSLHAETEQSAQRESGDLGAGPQAAEEMSGDYRPITNWSYRGDMNPALVGHGGGGSDRERGDEAAGDRPTLREGDSVGFDAARTSRPTLRHGMAAAGQAVAQTPGAGVERPVAALDEPQGPGPGERLSEREFFYDEWDGTIQDYRSGWCRVVEQPAPESGDDFAQATLAAHAPAVRLLRRYFENLRPPGMRRVQGQADGEEVDLDAAVRRWADRAAGAEPGDRIYVRREKRERDVAAVFLVDLSGSTSRQIESGERRVIDVEKEGVVVLCQALEAIGDQYAVYGYSGQGRRAVDCIVIKDFDERSPARAARRISALGPRHQNRDGAAIRHAVRRLQARSAKVKLLVLMSDGKPLDDGYAEEYSLEDTKMALREACMAGIHPFCITVDKQADDYLRRMYGEVRFLVIDRIAALPERLPRMYQRLTT